MAVFILAFATNLSVLAQTHDSGSLASGQHTHDGTISSGIYTNEFFEFSVEIPPGWKIGDNVRYQALNSKSREEAARLDPELAKLGQGAEINAPLLVMAETKPWMDGKQHRLVRILSTDASSRPGTPSAEEFLRFTADTNRKYGLSEDYVTKPEPIQLGGRTAWKAYFNQQGTVLWHSVNVAIVSKKHILQFILTSPDEEGLRSLETVLRTVRFKD
jgi:hypothetical protein